VGASLAISIPAGIRARRSSPFSSAQTYKRRMSMIAPRSRGGRWVVVPDGHSAALQRVLARRSRRRQTRILFALALMAIGSGAWAVAGGSVAWPVHLFIDFVFVTYAAVVIETRRRQAEQRRKVRSLARHPLSSSPSGWPEMDRESVAL
jgi:hypothetical protein